MTTTRKIYAAIAVAIGLLLVCSILDCPSRIAAHGRISPVLSSSDIVRELLAATPMGVSSRAASERIRALGMTPAASESPRQATAKTESTHIRAEVGSYSLNRIDNLLGFSETVQAAWRFDEFNRLVAVSVTKQPVHRN